MQGDAGYDLALFAAVHRQLEQFVSVGDAFGGEDAGCFQLQFAEVVNADQACPVGVSRWFGCRWLGR